MRLPLLPMIALLVTLTTAVAHADEVVSYALVVGSNRPGPGQTALAFAEDDAARSPTCCASSAATIAPGSRS
jgi:hypothetical protein